MKIKTFEELVSKYPLKPSPFGMAAFVPGDEFDPDLEVILGDQGCRFHFVDIADKPFTLVQKGNGKEDEQGEEGEESAKVATKEDSKTESLAEFPWSDEDEKKLLQLMNQTNGTVYERAALLMPDFPGRTAVALRQKYYKLTGLKAGSKRKGRPKPELLHVPWNAKEDDLLIELWKKRKTVSAIATEFPSRSYESVKMRLQVLRKLKKIEPRWKRHKKREVEKEPKASKREKIEKKEHSKKTVEIPTSTPIEIPTHGLIELPVKEDPIVTLLKEIRDLLVKRSEPKSVSFEAYCRKCRDHWTLEEEEVWHLCPVCGGELIIWNVEVEK